MSSRRKIAIGVVVVALAQGTLGQTAEPLKVFILIGQSNMQGHGVIAADERRNGGQGSLEFVARDVSNKHAAGLRGDDGKWIVRNDVSIWYLGRAGGLTAGYGAQEKRIGPELGFGTIVGDAIDEPVLLIKCAWGGKSLAVDFRPPSSGKIPYDVGKGLQEKLKKEPDTLGHYYRLTLKHVREVLANIKKTFPSLADRRPQIAGIGWHQGWNDRVNQAFNDEYEKNMVNFIRDIRRDLGLKDLPFVIAETGMSGHQEKHPRALSLMRAQAAVAKLPEFRSNVSFVGTKDFFRPKEQSPSGQAYHWNTNAETYLLIGRAMGSSMLKMVKP